jgi:30S ribosomal protein S31
VGRGDKRTAKGKRFKGTFGVSRPKNAKKGGKKVVKKATVPAKKATTRK